jgi:hypothetical protein
VFNPDGGSSVEQAPEIVVEGERVVWKYSKWVVPGCGYILTWSIK